MGTLFRFGVLLNIKLLARLFYRFDVSWVGQDSEKRFDGARLGLLLNHTSLFEPLFIGVLPVGLLWRIARNGVFPGADITMNRPVAGKFYRLLARDAVSITRKRDQSWQDFLDRIDNTSIVLIAPEGRMKRPSGLDKEGKPMTVRGGVADLLTRIRVGTLILTYSGGLHHVHAPGQRWPRVFKRVRVKFERLDMESYRRQLGEAQDPKAFRLAVARDMERRRDLHC